MAVDQAAARALAAVDESGPSQIQALVALAALAAACARDGALVREVRRLLGERQASFTSFQLERAARVTDRLTLVGEGARAEAVRVVADALLVVAHISADSGDARALRLRLDSLKRGGAGKAVPFFARFLAHQQR